MSKKPKLLIRESYLKLIKNSVGSKVWRNLYAQVGEEKKKDILGNGKLACSFFVSSVLLIFGLIKESHATVKGTLKDMADSGWQEIKELKIGSVLLWEEKRGHRHLGFLVAQNQAISNSSKRRSPQLHHFTFGKNKQNQPVRKIEKIIWHKKLNR